MRGTGRSPFALTAAAVCFAGAALIVAMAAAVGPAEVSEPGWLSTDDRERTNPNAEPGQMPTLPVPTSTPVESSTDSVSVHIPWWAGLVAVLAVAGVVLYLLLRALPWSTLRHVPRAIVGGHVDELPDAAEDLRAGVRAASDALSGEGAQAVIDAWLALESAAAATGAARGAAQTPSEFTADLLRRHHADSTGTSTLLALYHRARFSPDPGITPDDVAIARQALRSILDTLASPRAEHAPTASPGNAP